MVAEPSATEPQTREQWQKDYARAKTILLFGRHKGCRKHGSLMPVSDAQRYETTQHPLAVPAAQGGFEMLPPTVTDRFSNYRVGAKLFQCTGCKRTISIA